MKQLSYVILLIVGMMSWGSCADNDMVPTGNGDAVELTDIAPRMSRATVAPLADYVGKPEFDDQDRIVFTAVRRTEHPILQFNYSGLEYVCAASTTTDGKTSIGWTRDATKGQNLAGASETYLDRIYWSDAVNPHTFIGYCTPQQGDGNPAFDWNMHQQGGLDTYFGSIGDPTVYSAGEQDAGHYVDFRTTGTAPNAVSGNVELRKNDILLTHSTTITASDAIAQLKFYHGLAQARVIVSISDFAAGGGADTQSVVSDMVLKAMPTMYKWKGQNAETEPLIESDQNTIDGIYTSTPAPSYNQAKDFRLWIPHPTGVGLNANKTFTFYGLAVPTLGSSTQQGSYTQEVHFTFKVTYPDPMHPTSMKDANYSGSISGIRFDAGKCTTINITLNHRNEKMTVGAEYDEWDFVDTPDQGALKKHSTCLDTAERDSVTIFGDQKATVDDATWLYVDPSTKELRDVYGNDGTPAHPFVISTAREMLSFAYEVTGAYDKMGKQRPATTYKNLISNQEVTLTAGAGFDFTGYYIHLDADITLQPSAKVKHDSQGFYTMSGEDRTTVAGVMWPGIGDARHPFGGIFLGGSRRINRICGAEFFHTLGSNAVVDKLNFDDVLEVQGAGVVARENNGLICSCYLDGDVMETNTSTQYTGSIVGTNNSFIIACSHIGKVTGYGQVGGLVGFNNGTVIACYHSGRVETKTAGGVAYPTVGNYGDGTSPTNNSIMFSCYYDSRAFPNSRTPIEGKLGFPLSTAVMQSRAFVDSSLDSKSFVDDGNGNFTATGPILRTIAETIVKTNHSSQYTDDQISAMTEEELLNIILPADAMSNDVLELFNYHFSLNTALQVFRYWINRIHKELKDKPNDATIVTNCHSFSKPQIEFLYNHYDGSHVYKYAPATYPRTQ